MSIDCKKCMVYNCQFNSTNPKKSCEFYKTIDEKVALHCMKVVCEETLCEECDIYGLVGTDHCVEDACRVAIKALEKQIPRELTHIRKVKEYDGYDMGNCSVCGEPLDNSFYENLKYCFVCGQAIKWD